MAYTKLGWVNDRAPALNQTNLNHMDQGIYDAHRKMSEYEDIFTGDVGESVQNWLDEHPEATTSVEDHSLTYVKLVNGTLGFVTPEMFGAVGDGVTDDSNAIEQAISTGKVVKGDPTKRYLIRIPVSVEDGINSKVVNCYFTSDLTICMFDLRLNSLELENCTADGQNIAYGFFSPESFFEDIKINLCTFENMDTVLDGTWPTSRALRVRANNAVISDCIISNNRGHGLIAHLDNSNLNARYLITNCIAENNGEFDSTSGLPTSTALGIGCLTGGENNAQITITNCVANGNGASGIAPHCFNNVTISNCIANNNGEHGLVLMQSVDSIITGCSCTGNLSCGIRVQGDFALPKEDRFCDNIIVSNNIITQQGQGIKVGVSTKNVLVKNNILINTVTPILTDNSNSIRGCNYNSENLIFLNNVISHRGYYTWIDIDAFKNFIVKDNYYLDGTPYPNGKYRIDTGNGKLFISYGNCTKYITPENLLTLSFSGLNVGTTYDAANKQITIPTSISSGGIPCEFRFPANKITSVYCKVPDGFIPHIRLRGSGGLIGSWDAYTYTAENGHINEMTITLKDINLSNVTTVCLALKATGSIPAGTYSAFAAASAGFEVHGDI